MAESSKNGSAQQTFKKIHNAIGFTQGYAFCMWFIFGGALSGFILARLQYLDIDGRFCPRVPAPDGSTGLAAACYWVVNFKRYRVGMVLHLATSLPAGLLAVFQFVPKIRHKAILYHRIAGYVAITLAFVGNIGACMLVDTAMGGELSMQALVGFVTVITAATLGLAVYNIKKLQLEQHRVWMLRTWAILGFIVTLRLIQLPMASIIATWPQAAKYISVNCKELRYIYFAKQNFGEGTYTQENLEIFESNYPACAEPGSDGVYVAVKGLLNPTDPGQSNAALMTTFAAAGWLALVLHVLVVEAYIWLTPAESQRLRKISYERQLERGYNVPGSRGTVAQRFGHADEWLPEHPMQTGSDAPSGEKSV